MPAFGVVTLGPIDSVTYTYNPSNLTGGTAFNVNRASSTYPSGYQVLQRGTRGPVQGNGLYRVSLKLNDPVVVGTDSACGCAGQLDYTNSCAVEFVLSEKSTAAMRTALRKKMAALLADASVVAEVDNLEYIWA
jgi:hypothetical protein